MGRHAAGRGGRATWAIDRDGRRLVHLDPKTGTVLAQGRIHNGFVEDAAVAGGSLWLPVENDGGVWQLDRSASIVGKVDTGQVPWALAVDGRDVYVSNQNSGTVTRIDALTHQTRQYAVGHRPLALGVESGRLWVFVGQSAEEARARITGSHVVAAVTPGDPFFLTDPATLRGYAQHALQYAVGVRLMDVKVATNGTTTLYPSGAVGPPALSHSGRSLTFVVRPGFRYSPPSGAAVTAADWKFSIERALSPVTAPPSRTTVSRSSATSPASMPTRRSARRTSAASWSPGPRITFTLTKPSPTFPARLANACFTSVPLGTPAIVDAVAQPIASAGPYYIDSHIEGQQLILRRNPNYTGPRKRLVDAIVFRNGFDPGRAASLVAAGSADYTFPNGDSDTAPSMTPGRALCAHARRRRRQRAPVFPAGILGHPLAHPQHAARAAARCETAPGDQAGARPQRRRKVDGAVPATRMIPPGVPGYAAQQKPLVGGPRRARALIGNRKIHLAMYTFEGGGGGGNVERARLVRASLGAVGIHLSVHVVGDPWTFAARNPSQVDILFDGWAPDYLDASDMLNELLDPRLLAGGLYPPFFTDPRWLARLRAAASTTGAGRAAAYSRLDRALAEGPTPAVPVVYLAGTPQLFSKRIGCHTFLPQYTAWSTSPRSA